MEVPFKDVTSDLTWQARIGERLLPAYFPESLPFFSFPFSLFPIKSLEQANNRQIPRLAFTANGKRKFVPRDQVFHLLVV